MSEREQAAINLSGVGIRRGKRWILRDVNWRVPPGVCAAILGPNGCGKSTLTRVLAAHVWPTAGQVEILGEKFGATDMPTLRKSIRLVQSAGPYDAEPELTAREVVITGFLGTIGLYEETTREMRESAERLLAQVGLSHVAEQQYSTLSSGERVRTLIARALAARPELLLLDEPTAGLDLLAREQVLATVQALFESSTQSPPTVVLVTHHVEELPPATSRILLLSQGITAADGAPQDVLRSDILSKVYGCPLEVRYSHDRYSVHVHPSAWRGLLNGDRGA